MRTQISEATVPLLDFLSQRATQAQEHGATYLAPVADQDSMLHWLSQACSAAREAAGRRQVHVAASANVDQSTIARFEKATAWPRHTDRVVRAYAEDLDIDAAELWAAALQLWQDDKAGDVHHVADITEELVKGFVDPAGTEQADAPAAVDTSSRPETKRESGRARRAGNRQAS